MKIKNCLRSRKQVRGSGSCPSFPKKYIVGGLSFLVFIKVVILHSHCLSKEVCGVI